MKRVIIAEGNYCKTSYFATNGKAEYHIGVKDNAEDEYKIVYDYANQRDALSDKREYQTYGYKGLKVEEYLIG